MKYKIKLEDVLRVDRPASIYRDMGHGVSFEQPRRWEQVKPGMRRPVNDGEARIGICIADYADGPEWFTLAEADLIAQTLAGVVAGARAIAQRDTEEGPR